MRIKQIFAKLAPRHWTIVHWEDPAPRPVIFLAVVVFLLVFSSDTVDWVILGVASAVCLYWLAKWLMSGKRRSPSK